MIPLILAMEGTFTVIYQFQIIQIEENFILLNDSASEFKILLEKVHSFNISI